MPGKSGAKKHGKNKPKCEHYRQAHRREKNKATRLKAMIKKLPSSNNMRKQAEKRIKELDKEN